MPTRFLLHFYCISPQVQYRSPAITAPFLSTLSFLSLLLFPCKCKNMLLLSPAARCVGSWKAGSSNVFGKLEGSQQ